MDHLDIKNLEAIADFLGDGDIFDVYLQEVYDALGHLDENSELEIETQYSYTSVRSL